MLITEYDFRFYICELGLDTSEEGYFEATLKLASHFNRSNINGWFVFQVKLHSFHPRTRKYFTISSHSQRDGAISVRSIATLLSYDIIMAIMCTISISLATRTFLDIRAAKALSFSDRTSQLRILFTVCIQVIHSFAYLIRLWFPSRYSIMQDADCNQHLADC